MKKRVLSIILLVCMIAVFCPIPAQAETLLEITVEPPVSGSKPSSDVSLSVESIGLEIFSWYEDGSEMPWNVTFQGGKTYRVSMYFFYLPDSDLKVTVNGMPATVTRIDIDYFQVSYTFPVLDGWQVTDEKYYYYKDGAIQTGWVKEGSYFYLDPSTGAWTGWLFYMNNMYFYDTTSRSYKTGWLLYNGNLYYFNPATNAMMTGWVYEGGKFYYFSPSSGALQVGWVWVANQETFFYIDPSTGAWTGWLYYHGNTYFYDTVINNFWTGWLQYNGYYFYLDPATGIMVTGTKVIGGKTYQFNSYGVCIGY